jgi:polyferredoxin
MLSQIFSTENNIYLALTAAALVGFWLKWRWTRYVLLLVSVVTLGFLQLACPSPIDAYQNLALHWREAANSTNLLIKIGIVLVPALLFGKLFCGWICQKGVIQEFVFQRKLRWDPPARVDRALRKVKYLVLAATIAVPMIWGLKVFNRETQPFKVIWNLSGGWFAIGFLAVIILASLFIYRAYCRYICPLGALLALVGYVSRVRFRVPEGADCNGCGRVQRECLIGAMQCPDKSGATLRVDRGECIMCGECRVECGRGAVGIRFWR